MSDRVLGRDPFSAIKTPLQPALLQTEGEPDPTIVASLPVNSERGKQRRARLLEKRQSRLATASRAAVRGVVREAQAALDARYKPVLDDEPAENEEPTLRPQRQVHLDDSGDGQFDLFGFDPAYLNRIWPGLEFLYRSYFRVGFQNVEFIPPAGRALVVANHAGALPYDALMLMTGVMLEHARQRHVRPLIHDAVWHFPYLGVLMRRLGGARADQENAERLLNGENVVAVFPEGLKGSSKLYHKKYQLQRFGRGGFVKLALRTRAPIIPAAIVGSEDVHPLLGKVTKVVRTMGVSYLPLTPTFPWLGPLGLLPLPVKWNIELCEPISVDAYADGADSDPELVNELSEQVRQAIQRKLDDNLRLRQSILFG